MKKVSSYVVAYAMWLVDIALAFWFIYISRSAYLGTFALFYKKGDFGYSKFVGFIDKAFILFLGLGWMAFMIIVEEFFRIGIQKGNLLKRIARVTGLVLLAVFVVDLILFWLQGISSDNWLRWLLLAAELGTGTALFLSANTLSAKTRLPSKPN